MYHAIHAFGLAELLRSGSVADVDEDHFWDLIDNTYVDDVSVMPSLEFSADLNR
jgi:hypothetical protein